MKFSTSFEWIFRNVDNSLPQFFFIEYTASVPEYTEPSFSLFSLLSGRPPSSCGKSVIDGRRDGTGGNEIGALRIYRFYLAAIYRTCGFSPPARSFIVRSFYFPPFFSRRYNLYNTTGYFLLDFFFLSPLLILASRFILPSRPLSSFIPSVIDSTQLISLRGVAFIWTQLTRVQESNISFFLRFVIYYIYLLSFLSMYSISII